MQDKIKIKNLDRTEEEVNLITIITLDKYKSSYLVYTKEDIKDYNEVYFAKLGPNRRIIDIESDEEIKDLRIAYLKEMNS